MLVAGTRVAIGAGIGLLLSRRLNSDQSKAAGWALLAVGSLSSIPLAMEWPGNGLSARSGLKWRLDAAPTNAQPAAASHAVSGRAYSAGCAAYADATSGAASAAGCAAVTTLESGRVSKAGRSSCVIPLRIQR